MKKLIYILLFISLPIHATNYYLNNTGDNSDGLSDATAWTTIDSINNNTFSPGDSILLKCGSVFRETLTIPSSGTIVTPIYFGYYGTGDRPKIYGSNLALTFTNTSGNVWQSATTLNDPRSISAYDAAIWFHETDDSIKWGNFQTYVDLSELTSEYDWTWNANTIYVYAATDPDTRYTGVEVTQRLYPIYLNDAENIVIDSLDLRYGNYAGIKEEYPYADIQGLTVKNCYIGWMSERGSGVGYGIETYHNRVHIYNNEIRQVGRRGISIAPLDPVITGTMDSVIIENNTIYNCYHTGIDYFVTTANVTADSIIIRNNLIYEDDSQDSTYDGMTHISIIGHTSDVMTDVYVYNNVCRNTTSSFLYIYRAENVYMRNNSFRGVQSDAYQSGGLIRIWTDTKSFTFANNIVYNNWYQSYGTHLFSNVYGFGVDTTLIEIDSNLYYMEDAANVAAFNVSGAIGNAFYYPSEWEAYHTNVGWDQNSTYGDPLFTSSTDLTLQSSSPAIEAGTPITWITTDYAGNTRDATTPDIGAYEKTVVASTNRPNPRSSGTGGVYMRNGKLTVRSE